MGMIVRWWLRALTRATTEIQAENRLLNRSNEIKETALDQAPSEEFGIPLNIQVTPATGGQIVRFNKYDQQNDRNRETIYVIPNDDDFTDSLTTIINMELMKG